MPGRVLSILIAPAAGEPMQTLDTADLVAGKGISGDRYATGTGEFSPEIQDPDHEVTLIEKEMIDAFNSEYSLEVAASDLRRNIVTQGIALNELEGVEFSVGAVRLQGIRLCEPCQYLRDRTNPDVLRGFAHKGGLRAGIVRGGSVRVGDVVE
jgi:hypothetical protein